MPDMPKMPLSTSRAMDFDEVVWEALLGAGALAGAVQSLDEGAGTVTFRPTVRPVRGGNPGHASSIYLRPEPADVVFRIQDLWALGIGRKPKGWSVGMSPFPLDGDRRLNAIVLDEIADVYRWHCEEARFPRGSRKIRHALIGRCPMWVIDDDGRAELVGLRDLRTVRLALLRVQALLVECMLEGGPADLWGDRGMGLPAAAFESMSASLAVFIERAISIVEGEPLNRASALRAIRKAEYVSGMIADGNELVRNFRDRIGNGDSSILVWRSTPLQASLALTAGSRLVSGGLESTLLDNLHTYLTDTSAGDLTDRVARFEGRLPALYDQIRADGARAQAETHQPDRPDPAA